MFYTKLEGPALAAYTELRNKLKNKAMTQLGIPENDVIIRELRPEDVGLSTPEWTSSFTDAAGWNNFVNTYTIADNRFIGILGIRYPMSTSQAATQLKVKRGHSEARLWVIQGLNFLENEQQFVDDPVTVDQSQQLTMQVYCPTTNAAEKLMLLGLVAEKRGIVLNP